MSRIFIEEAHNRCSSNILFHTWSYKGKEGKKEKRAQVSDVDLIEAKTETGDCMSKIPPPFSSCVVISFSLFKIKRRVGGK